MHKLLITKSVEALAHEYLKNLKDENKGVKALEKLRSLLEVLKSGDCQINEGEYGKNKTIEPKGRDTYIKYVDSIIKQYDEIVVGHPLELYKKVSEFRKILDPWKHELHVKIEYKDPVDGEHYNERLVDLIIKLMNYDAVRKYMFPKLMQNLNIRTCVYCNTQYAITTEKKKAMFELDHLIPKSKAPFLCTSFFNLQPCCGSCNKGKGSNKLFATGTDQKFNLSIWKENESDGDLFRFELNCVDLCKYLLNLGNHDMQKIVINFHPTQDYKNIQKLYDLVEKHFKISSVYSELNDVAEEVAWKHIIYHLNT